MKLNKFNKDIHASFKYYLKHGVIKEYRSWKWIINYYLILISIIAIGSVLLFNFTNFLPPNNTILAAGQPKSPTRKIADSFEKSFTDLGVRLTIKTVAGSEEGLLKLDQAHSAVNASFYIAGEIDENDKPDIYSLGVIESAPVWLFYRGPVLDTDNPFIGLEGKRMAIGPAGSLSNMMFRKISDNGKSNADSRFNLQEISHSDAEQKLISGQIDALFISHALDNDLIAFITKNPDIHIFNFENLADAYVRRFSSLEKQVIPSRHIQCG